MYAPSRAWLDLLGRHLLEHLGKRDQFVELELVLLRGDLVDRREERLRVDEAREPRDLRDLHRVALPLVELVEPHLEVDNPRDEVALGRPRELGPPDGDGVHEERGHQ